MKVYDYILFVDGLFGKNRKPRTEVFDLAKDQMKPLTLEQVTELYQKKIASLNLRGKVSLKVTEQPCETENMGGYTSKQFMLFTDKQLIKETINV